MAKIMQLNITCGIGSTGDIAVRLYYASQNAGFDVRYAYTAFSPTISEAFCYETKLQHYFRRGMNRFFGKKQSHSSCGTNRLIRYIKKEKPDLIHIHNVQQNSLNYIKFFEFLKNYNIPVVYTLHDCWSFTGGCYHFCKYKCEKYSNAECVNCVVDLDDISISSEKAYGYKRDLIGSNDNIHIICVSNWLKDSAAKSYMAKMKNPPITIYNGIDTKLFYPRESLLREKLGIRECDFVILGVASYWNSDKGLEYFEALSEKVPESFKIILVGKDLENTQKKHKQIICISPTQNREKLAELYSSADVFLNPSVVETFGLTTAEALACGTPAIVFNTTACPEIIDSETGLFIEYSGNFENELNQIICAIEKIEKSRGEYSNACVERIHNMFTTEKMTDSYIYLYRRILSEV